MPGRPTNLPYHLTDLSRSEIPAGLCHQLLNQTGLSPLIALTEWSQCRKPSYGKQGSTTGPVVWCRRHVRVGASFKAVSNCAGNLHREELHSSHKAQDLEANAAMGFL